MGREGYANFMAAISVGVPLLVALGGSLARWLPPGLVNLPNRDYWLAPDQTMYVPEDKLLADMPAA